MGLRTKFIGAVLFGVSVALAGTASLLIREQNHTLRSEAEARARRVLSFCEACREYARSTLSPAVRKHTDSLIFEANSATFVARGTFEAFQKHYPEYVFREAALNPLNLANLADEEDKKVISRFQDSPTLPEITGFRNAPSGKQFFIARPIVVQKVCLECHASPQTAPKEVVRDYGTEHGYGWQEGEINSIIMTAVPTEDYQAEQTKALIVVLAIFAGLAVVLGSVVFVLFDRLVTQRLARAATVMSRIAAHPQENARVEDQRPDEIGAMAAAFNHMADALGQSHASLEQRVAERTTELSAANQVLQKEITERQQAQERLRGITAELERSNAELEQFAYVASHDLQEPLRMVASYLELLAQRYQGQLDDKADRWIHFAVDAAARMKQLINDLLEYARVGSRGKPLTPIASAQAVAAAIANLQQAIGECGAEVTYRDLPMVLADKTQLIHLFQNLISNALKYRGADKPVIHIAAQRQANEMVFSVRDNGIGIDPQFAERIFGIFQRLHTREQYSGTGIGLALCKKIVERHGGRMWVESQLGQGATFCFALPVRDGLQ